jgi:hypothetical protein
VNLFIAYASFELAWTFSKEPGRVVPPGSEEGWDVMAVLDSGDAGLKVLWRRSRIYDEIAKGPPPESEPVRIKREVLGDLPRLKIPPGVFD